LGKARERLGVSKVTMARLVREGRFKIYQNPLDRRQKLVDEAELERAIQPHPALANAGSPDGNPDGQPTPPPGTTPDA
jgi:hypothetical protein